MTVRQNLHMHSTWDDGKNTAEEMIAASHAAGLQSVGVSLHSPMPEFCPCDHPEVFIPAYLREIRALANKFADRITVYAGIEWDVLSDIDLTPFDYVIGSVHELPVPGVPAVDHCPEVTERFLAEHFGGDADAAAECFFGEYAKVAHNPEVDIVGHFDLLTKFDEQHRFFNPDSRRYRDAARAAMEELVRADKIFEVNTGAISRGYRTTPYPSPELMGWLRELDARVTIGADAHHVSGVVCAFDKAEALVRASGFAEIWELGKNGFAPISLR